MGIRNPKTIYFLIDCSGSMDGARADAVNNAMQRVVQEALPVIKMNKDETIDLSFVAYGFSDCFPTGVKELMGKTDLDDFTQWEDIESDMFKGGTPTGVGIQAVIDDISCADRGVNDAVPAIILISDGMPNCGTPSYEEVMKKAIKGDPCENPIFRRSLRFAIGINVDDDGRRSLMQFGNVSRKMQASGIQSYYDCSEQYVDNLIEIIKSATINASLGGAQ